MIKKSLSVLLLLVLATFILTACSSSAGNKFVGKWSAPSLMFENQREYIEIATNDNKKFGINWTNKNGVVLHKEVAVLKDDSLEIDAFDKLTIHPDGSLPYRAMNFTKDAK